MEPLEVRGAGTSTLLGRKALPVGVGFAVAGITSYGFLILAARQLGPARYAALSALWTLIVLVGPGFFMPFEQELARACALRRHNGDGVRPALVIVATVGGLVALLLVAVSLVASPVLLDEVLDDQPLLLASFVVALLAYCAQHLARGLLSGNGRLRAYGVLVGGEGTIRLVGAAALVLAGVGTAGPFGAVLALGTLLSIIIALLPERGLADPGTPASRSEVTSSLGALLLGSVLAQALLNAAPLAAKILAGPADDERVGRFLAALVIARVPLFLFQAVQAALLPHLTKAAAEGDVPRFRRSLQYMVVLLLAFGLAGTVAAALVGPQLLRLLFGKGFVLGAADIAYLVAGTVLYMLAIVAAQGLIALGRQSVATLGWLVGLVAFAVALAVPDDLLLRCEVAFLVGSAVAAGTLVAVLARAASPRPVKELH